MTSVKYDFEFLAGFCTDATIQLNKYILNLHLYINTESDIDQQTAFERMNLMMYDIVDNCIFINETDQLTYSQLSKSDFRILTIPDPGPIDQIIQMVLVNKLNSVTSDKIHIFESEMSSQRGGYVKYMYFSSENTDENTEIISTDTCEWWNNDSLTFNNITEQEDIIDFADEASWHTVNLEWEDELNDISEISNIITMPVHNES